LNFSKYPPGKHLYAGVCHVLRDNNEREMGKIIFIGRNSRVICDVFIVNPVNLINLELPAEDEVFDFIYFYAIEYAVIYNYTGL